MNIVSLVTLTISLLVGFGSANAGQVVQKSKKSTSSRGTVEVFRDGSVKVYDVKTGVTTTYRTRTGLCTPPHRAWWCDAADLLVSMM